MYEFFGICIILLSTAYLLSFFCICLFGAVRDIRICRIQLNIILWMMIIAYASLSFFIIGRKGWDLNVYYSVIDKMRVNGINAIQSVGTIDFFDLPIIKGMFYLISKLPYNNFLQMIAVFIDYTFLILTIKAILGKRERRFRVFATFFFVHFAMSSFPSTISGVRNTMAFSILFLAVVRDILQDKKNILTLLLYIIPLGIHTSTVIVIILRLICLILSKKPRLQYFLLVWTFVLRAATSMLGPVNKGLFLNTLFDKADYYMNLGIANLFSNFKYELFRIIIILLLSYITKKCIGAIKEDNRQKTILQFVRITCFMALGSLQVYEIFNRLCIFIGWISFLPISFYVGKTDIWNIKKVCFCMLLFSGVLILMNIHHLFIYSLINIPWS